MENGIHAKSAYSSIHIDVLKSKCFTYVTKTCANLTKYTVKLGNKELFGHPKIVP